MKRRQKDKKKRRKKHRNYLTKQAEKKEESKKKTCSLDPGIAGSRSSMPGPRFVDLLYLWPMIDWWKPLDVLWTGTSVSITNRSTFPQWTDLLQGFDKFSQHHPRRRRLRTGTPVDEADETTRMQVLPVPVPVEAGAGAEVEVALGHH